MAQSTDRWEVTGRRGQQQNKEGNKTMKLSSAYVLALGALVAAVLTGCTTPDVQPFADATSSMGKGFRQVGESTVLILRDVPFPDPQSHKQLKLSDPKHPSHTFSTAWGEHLAAVDAMEAYSAALAELAAVNRASKENAEALVEPLVELADNFPDIDAPAAEIGSVIALIKQTADEAVTYWTMAQQVKSAHPVFEKMVPLLKKALAKALVINRSAYVTFTVVYEAEQNQLTTRWNGLETKIVELEDRYLQMAGTAQPDDVERRELAARVKTVSEMQERLRPEYEAFTKGLASIRKRMEGTEQLFTQSQLALDKWLKGHATLVRALEEKRQPNFTVLLTRAEEIRDAIEAVKSAQAEE